MLLHDATLLTAFTPGAEVLRGSVRVRDGRIVAVGALEPVAGERVVAAHGRLVTPGLVCGHTHLYSALARGMPLVDAEPPRDFLETLGKIWWRLDRALDDASVVASARVGMLDALRWGTVGLIDHHASPHAVDGSLDRLADAAEALGVRLSTCYEVSDRDGVAIRDAGLRENARFAAARKGSPWAAAMIGAHASFTLSDDSLDRLAALCDATGLGLHIHLAEGGDDRRETQQRHGRALLGGLDARGLLGPRTLLAHAIDVDPAELALIAERGAAVVHNPASNLNNRVGFRPAWAAEGTVLLGTDGIGADMLESARTAFFRGREARPDASPDAVLQMLDANARTLYGQLGVDGGALRPGAVADLVLWDYDPPTPLHRGNVGGHLVFGLSSAHVGEVYSGGVLRYARGAYPGLDVAAEMAAARHEAERLWARMAAGVTHG
jgi:putative selenium metabolism protein SsnA